MGHGELQEGFLERLRGFQPDLCVTAAYGSILPRAFLDIPRCGTLNIHPSLLPRWRGAAPVPRAIEVWCLLFQAACCQPMLCRAVSCPVHAVIRQHDAIPASLGHLPDTWSRRCHVGGLTQWASLPPRHRMTRRIRA